MAALDRDQLAQLEQLIDQTTLYAVVEALTNITAEKGTHIVSTWQDRPTAAPWFRAGNILERALRSLETLGI